MIIFLFLFSCLIFFHHIKSLQKLKLKHENVVSNFVGQEKADKKLILDLQKKIESKENELETVKKREGNSKELTEFLADFNSYGYSFVRVDPGAVFMRSPREL
jgi:hypothetical protein